MKKTKLLQIVAETANAFNTQSSPPFNEEIFNALINLMQTLKLPYPDMAGRAKQLMRIHRQYIANVQNKLPADKIADNLFVYDKLLNKLYEVYDDHKKVIKEDVDKIKFTDKIRGVFYEYVQTVPTVTPTTQNPVRDPENKPDNTIKKGENMEKMGQALKDFGNKTKELQQDVETLEEYVQQEILPTVVEIIKHTENPKATKKELLEMFNIRKRKKI